MKYTPFIKKRQVNGVEERKKKIYGETWLIGGQGGRLGGKNKEAIERYNIPPAGCNKIYIFFVFYNFLYPIFFIKIYITQFYFHSKCFFSSNFDLIL